jgi:hypothetical protein
MMGRYIPMLLVDSSCSLVASSDYWFQHVKISEYKTWQLLKAATSHVLLSGNRKFIIHK